MKKKLTIIALTLFVTFVSCKNSMDNLKGNKVFQVSFENCKTSIDLNLCDLVENCNLIQLETTNESLVGNSFRIILSNDYIIVLDRSGILKFTNEGKFISKIINIGKGPQEISPSINYFFYEKNNLLFIEDVLQNKDILLIYDIEKEKFLDPVRKCFPGRWGSFVIYNDSLIMGTLSPVISDTNRYALFIQNFKGKLITGTTGNRKILDARNKSATVQRLVILTGDEELYTYYIYDDTLFRLKDNKLFPYLTVSYKAPRNFIRSVLPDVGESRVGFPSVDNSCFMILNEIKLEGSNQTEMATRFNYKRNYYLLNKSDSSFARINSYSDNITGILQESNGETLNLPVIHPGGKIHVKYDYSDLIGREFKSDSDSELSPSLYTQLREVQKNMNELDNPILLIGSIKKKI